MQWLAFFVVCPLLSIPGCAVYQTDKCPPPLVDFDREGPRGTETTDHKVLKATHDTGVIAALLAWWTLESWYDDESSAGVRHSWRGEQHGPSR